MTYRNKITYHQGNLLDVIQGHIVHGCNAQGVMGSGVAAGVKQKYPACFEKYVDVVSSVPIPKRMTLVGREIHWATPDGNLWLWNAITQFQHGRDPDLRYVNYEGLAKCFEHINDTMMGPFNTVAPPFNLMLHFPRIGAGLANGKWPVIESIIETTMAEGIKLFCWDLPDSPFASSTTYKNVV